MMDSFQGTGPFVWRDRQTAHPYSAAVVLRVSASKTFAHLLTPICHHHLINLLSSVHPKIQHLAEAFFIPAPYENSP